jgi:hypothetical protein
MLLTEGMARKLTTRIPWYAKLEAPRLWFDQLRWCHERFEDE